MNDLQDIWDPDAKTMDGRKLRTAIVLRHWVAKDFAQEAGVAEATLYGVCRGKVCYDRTAMKILHCLAKRDPLPIAS